MRMGYCGDVCDYCPRYIATQSGDFEKLKQVAVLWYKGGARSTVVPPEEMTCHGCSPSKSCIYRITDCASKRNIDHCGECSDYPCSHLESLFQVIPNLAGAWKKVCSHDQYELVTKAFLQKKENLEQARQRPG